MKENETVAKKGESEINAMSLEGGDQVTESPENRAESNNEWNVYVQLIISCAGNTTTWTYL